MNYDIDGIDLLRKAEKHGDVENFGATELLDDKQLKKIKILQMRAGVAHVDRHGFRDVDTAAMMIEAKKKHSLR